MSRYEELDTRPVARPVGWRAPEPLAEMVRRLVRTELSQQAAQLGAETFEEADDFDVGDDYDPVSPWELSVDQEDARQGDLFRESGKTPVADDAKAVVPPIDSVNPSPPSSSK